MPEEDIQLGIVRVYDDLPRSLERPTATEWTPLRGKRVAMVTFSGYPGDPRPRRAAETFIDAGATVDLVCLADEKGPWRETLGALDVVRIPMTHDRGGKLSYVYQYCTFILSSAAILAYRAIKKPYDLAHVHNMPDILVVSALIPKLLGARVLLDLHDPMPELMTTIFNVGRNTISGWIIRRLEKWSIARSDMVVTVNRACKQLFASRSCQPEKIRVVMNVPDEKIFPFHRPHAKPMPNEAILKPFVIMYHGSLVQRNGLDLAVKALLLVRKTIPRLELRIYGREAPYLQRVLEMARTEGLGDYVRYLGPKRLEDLVREIQNCDVGIIPNRRNVFTDINTPTRIFEYLALGKPVIAPNTVGIGDYFDPASLFFFDSGDAASLARQIEYVFSHPEEVFRTVERGQNVFLAHTWMRERQTLLDLASQLLSV